MNNEVIYTGMYYTSLHFSSSLLCILYSLNDLRSYCISFLRHLCSSTSSFLLKSSLGVLCPANTCVALVFLTSTVGSLGQQSWRRGTHLKSATTSILVILCSQVMYTNRMVMTYFRPMDKSARAHSCGLCLPVCIHL